MDDARIATVGGVEYDFGDVVFVAATTDKGLLSDAFVSRMDLDDRSRQLVRTVLQLSRSIGLDAVAEGVSTLAQLAELRRLDCDYGQGFLFSAPIDAATMAELIDSNPQW